VNGHRFYLSLLVTVTLLPIFAAADESRDNDGQYFCLVEHVAGVVSDGKGGPKHSGQINLPENEMKFFITVAPRIPKDIDRQVCENDINYWFMEIFKKGLPYKDQAPGSKAADHRGGIGQRCFASTEITLKFLDDEKFTMIFFGYGGYAEFRYSSGDPSTWFELYKDTGHTFLMGIGHLYGGPVVEDGHCTKIEPPK
jgi:hypothetical protein